jgi:hypothetical protein
MLKVCLMTIAALVAITPIAVAQQPVAVSVAVTPGVHPVGSQLEDCFWGYPIANPGPSNVLNQSFNEINWDTNNTYYVNKFSLPTARKRLNISGSRRYAYVEIRI